MLSIIIQSENKSFGEVIVRLEGSLDSLSAIDFYDTVKALEARGFSKFILNCISLESLSSVGISILLRIRKKFQEKNFALIFISLNSEIRDLFFFFGFNKTFLIAEDKESAEKLLETLYFYKPDTSEFTLTKNRIGILEDSEISTASYTDITLANTESLAVEDSLTDEEEPVSDSRPSIPAEDTNPGSDFVSRTLPPTERNFQTLTEDSIPELETEPLGDEDWDEEFIQEEEPKGFTIPLVTKSFNQDETMKTSIMVEEFDPESKDRFIELVINCGKCGTKIKIKKQGKQKCPTCYSVFLLRQSGSISTIDFY
ncbi:MAG: STAS domain-containing protein [Leptospiraceae bacterium]|nr:STAS domain-containing protein [Leptospiraceae bacterium]